MIGTVQASRSRGFSWIKQAGYFHNCYDPRYILQQPPRDGTWIWYGANLPSGTRVSFDRKPGTGTMLLGGVVGIEAVAVNVVAL